MIRKLYGRPCLAILSALLLAACASPVPHQSGAIGTAPSAATDGKQASPKRIVTSVKADLVAANAEVSRAISAAPSPQTLERFLNAGVVLTDRAGDLQPELAERVPSLNNGLWTLDPDGQMVTVLKIRDNAVWHDGTPITSADLMFTARVWRDPEIAASRSPAFDSVDRVEAPDAKTVRVHWKEPFIHADTLFGSGAGLPIAQHIFEPIYGNGPSAFLQSPAWAEGYIGSGPFKLRDWVRDSYVHFIANDQYVLGRPKLDEIEVRIIPDANALISSMLAGVVETSWLVPPLTLEEAMTAREQYSRGRLDVAVRAWNVSYAQLRNPNPPIIANVQFRRALLHAIDRQALVDTFMYGQTSVAHSIVGPLEPEFAALDAAAVRYEYDPRKAALLLEQLGYVRGADGDVRDSAGQTLSIEHRTLVGMSNLERSIPAIAIDWQNVGVRSDNVFIPRQRLTADREWVATFPAFVYYRQVTGLDNLKRFRSSQAPSAATRWAGTNVSSYLDPTFDGLLDQYFTTVPKAERLDVASRAIHRITDQLPMLGMFYDADALLVSDRIENLTDAGASNTSAWNAYLWDVK